MKDKKPTLADLKMVAEKTGIPLRRLQQEYGVYEYSFISCKEAVEGYGFGYKSLFFPSNNYDFNDPLIVSYHEAWKEVSLREKPDVTALSFDEAIAFISVCYPHGEQFDSLVNTLERTIGSDLEKISSFMKDGRTSTFYEHNCPVDALAKRLMAKVEDHYAERVSKAGWSTQELLTIKQEAETYGFADYRPFPEFFNVLAEKIIWSAKTINELFALPEWWPTLRCKRLKQLFPKATIDDVLPHLKNVLMLVKQSDDVFFDVKHVIDHFFHKCETLEQAQVLLNVGRMFFNTQEHDPVYENYKHVNMRILEKMYPHPQLKDFKELWNNTCISSQHRKRIEQRWKEASRKALQKPIPSFPELYKIVDNDYRLALLRLWNEWGIRQLEDVDSWEELSTFDIQLLPTPQSRAHWNYHVCFGPNEQPFTAFEHYLNKTIAAASNTKQLLNIRTLIMAKKKVQDEYTNSRGFFKEELLLVTKKIIEKKPSIELLWGIYESNRNNYSRADYLATEDHEMVIDELLRREPERAKEILAGFDEHANRLYPKYLRFLTEQTLHTP